MATPEVCYKIKEFKKNNRDLMGKVPLTLFIIYLFI